MLSNMVSRASRSNSYRPFKKYDNNDEYHYDSNSDLEMKTQKTLMNFLSLSILVASD